MDRGAGGRQQISGSPRDEIAKIFYSSHQREVMTCMWCVGALSKCYLSLVFLESESLKKQIEFACFRQGPLKQFEFYYNNHHWDHLETPS